jgi:hypothetical protein
VQNSPPLPEELFLQNWGISYCKKQFSDTTETKAVTGCVKHTFAQHGRPEIINCDQGSQFTSDDYINLAKKTTLKLSWTVGAGLWIILRLNVSGEP